LHSQSGLPGIEKPGSHSPTSTAQVLWCDVMKMPRESADFVVDTVEDVKFDGYDGILCVERIHFVEVKMRSQDSRVLGQIGLPEHSSFHTLAAQHLDNDRSSKRKFRWIPLSEFRSYGHRGADSDASCNLHGKDFAEAETARDDLMTLLRRGGVRPDSWAGPLGAMKIQTLLDDMRAGKCKLAQNSRGLVKVVNEVTVRIWSPDRQLVLVDLGRKKANGDESWSAKFPARETVDQEKPEEVALDLCNQVDLEEDDISFPEDIAWEFYEYTESATEFKGLKTKFQRYFVDAILEDDEDLFERVELPKEHRDAERIQPAA
jgi:hypothetical protein